MYIYKIANIYYNEKNEMDYSINILMHERKFSKEEFDIICKEELEKISDGSLFMLRQHLMDNRGFKDFHYECMFEYKEWEYKKTEIEF